MERRERDKQGNDQAQETADQQQAERPRDRGLGADFSGVQIHPNGAGGATASEQAFGAQAYTQGNDVHFGQGQAQPGAQDGKQLLAHELAHTVQQNNNNRE